MRIYLDCCVFLVKHQLGQSFRDFSATGNSKSGSVCETTTSIKGTKQTSSVSVLLFSPVDR